MTSWKNGMMEGVELRIYGTEQLWMRVRVEVWKCGSVEEWKSGVWMMWLGNP